MKRMFFAIPILIILLLIGLLVAPSFIDWNQYKVQAQKQIKTMTDLDLVLDGPVQLSLLPFPRVVAENVSLNAPPGSKNAKIFSLNRLEVNVDLLPLFSGNISVHSLTLIEPHITLEVLEDGKLNIMTSKVEEFMNAPEKTTTPQKSNTPTMLPLSLNKIRIQEASFVQYNHKTKKETVIDNLNADLSAKSFYGPYQGKGSVMFGGRVAEFEIQAEGYNPETKILSSQIEAVLQPGNIQAKFAGAINFSEGYSAQGQINLIIDDLTKTLAANNVESSSSASGELQAEGFLNADEKGLGIKDFKVSLAGQDITGSFETVYEPLAIKGALKTLENIDLAKYLPDMPALKTGAFDLTFSGNEQKIEINKGHFAINGSPYDLTGFYIPQKETNRPVLNLNVMAEEFNYDEIFGIKEGEKSVNSNASGDNLNQSASFSFPADIAFSVYSKTVQYKGNTAHDFKAKGIVTQNSVSVSQINFRDFIKTTLSASLEVKDIQALSGITLLADLKSDDPKGFATFLGQDTASFPENLNKASVKAKIEGSRQHLQATANVESMNGEIIAQLIASNPLDKIKIDDLAIQIKHRNMNEAMQIFSKSDQSDSAFNGPLDLYAKVQQNEKGAYNFSDIKGNLSGTTVSGTANVSMNDSKPYLNGDLVFGDIKLAAASQKSASAPAGKSQNQQPKSTQRWSKEPIDASAFNLLDANVTLKAKRFTYGEWVLLEPSGTIVIKDGTLNIPDLRAGLFEGSMNLSTTVQTAPQPRQPIHVTAQGDLKEVNVSRLVQALAGSELIKVSGMVSTDINIKTSGLSQAALVYDLNGSGNVTGSNIVLDGIDVERFAEALSEESKPGDTITGIWKGASKGGNTAFETLDGNYVITEGIATIHKLDLDGPQASIFTTGKIDLPNWTLSSKHKITAKNKPDVPPFEMAFSGPLDNPAQTFGQGLLNDYLQRKLQRKIDKNIDQFLSKKLGLPSGQQTPSEPVPQEVAPSGGNLPSPQQEQSQPQPQKSEQPKPEEMIEDVLKGLLQ